MIRFSESSCRKESALPRQNVAVSVTLGMSGITHDVIRPVDPALFCDDEGRPVELKVIDVLGESTINGRQIRNLVRLARILYPDRRVTHAQVTALMRYGCR